MYTISKETLQALRERFPAGTRVELVYMDDPYNTKLFPGSKGTVRCIDDMGTIHVKWDCGSSLGLVYGEDSCKKLDSVKITCYGETKVWDDRQEAIKEFLEGMSCCEGAERERYTNIYLQLINGCTECEDVDYEQED